MFVYYTILFFTFYQYLNQYLIVLIWYIETKITSKREIILTYYYKEMKIRNLMKWCFIFILLLGICVDITSQTEVVKRDNDDKEKDNKIIHDDDDDDDDKDEKHDEIDSKKPKEDDKVIKNFGFIHAFVASISVIVVSELGDKTFFIAAIMAMKHPRLTVYLGAMGALGLMTLLSALLGNIVTKVIPKVYTYYASSILFAIFGFKMLKEAYDMNPNDTGDEYEEAQAELRRTEEEQARDSNGGANANEIDLEAANASTTTQNAQQPQQQQSNSQIMITTRKLVVRLRKYLSPIFLQSFILTFLAEWGDRSQISTIILGARENMAGTIIGGTMGHGICTGLAVIGGRMIAQKISVKTVTYAGAFVFLFFAFSAFVLGPDDD